MKTASNVQGHCQACGRIQVVIAGKGVMSNHGYKVRAGYFSGVCIGHDHLPLEKDRSYLDWVVEYLGDQAEEHDARANDLESGVKHPGSAMKRQGAYDSIVYHSHRHEDPKLRGQAVWVRWDEASPVERHYQLHADISSSRTEANIARSHAAGLVELAARVHGQPLIDREAVERAERKARAEKKQPIEGAYRTKAAQKDDLEKLNRQYRKFLSVISDRYLSEPSREYGDAGSAVYYGVPSDLHAWRPAASALVRKVYPELEATVVDIEALVAQREVVKSRPVVK